jgi:ATP-dependent DNA helicase RecG
MRPSLLDPLFAPAVALSGVGPRTGELIARAVGVEDGQALVRDLLFHLPTGLVDRGQRPPLHALPRSGVVTVEGVVERLEKPSPGRALWRVILAEGNAAVQIVYFHAQSDWLRKLYPIGARRIVSGEVEWFDMRPQIKHPEYVIAPEDAGDLPQIEPVYRLTAGLSPKSMRRAIGSALERLPKLPEWLSAELVAARGWPAFDAALRAIHQPERVEAAQPDGAAWRRLAFDELLASQLALMLVRGKLKRGRGTAWLSKGKLRRQIQTALP